MWLATPGAFSHPGRKLVLSDVDPSDKSADASGAKKRGVPEGCGEIARAASLRRLDVGSTTSATDAPSERPISSRIATSLSSSTAYRGAARDVGRRCAVRLVGDWSTLRVIRSFNQ